jgi:RNA polymerase sigma-70 factor, ECF subfamily
VDRIEQVQDTDEACPSDRAEDRCEISDDRMDVKPSSLAGKCRSTHPPSECPATGVGGIFESHRRRLFGIAYRMLGSHADADDVLQDAYLRWHQCAAQSIQSPLGFLVTITTRLCLDRLRELKQEREQYVGPRLPEPIVEDHLASPEMQRELADEVSVGFLAVLERLGPEERTAFLLHDVFDYDYPEVAEVLGKAEPSCRQMIHRARARVRESRRRFTVTAESRERLLGKFFAAVGTGDRQAVMALLAEDVEYMADGGGKVVAALKVLRGPERLDWLYHCIARRFVGLEYRLVRVNGEVGAVCMMDGKLFSVFSFATDEERIHRRPPPGMVLKSHAPSSTHAPRTPEASVL